MKENVFSDPIILQVPGRCKAGTRQTWSRSPGGLTGSIKGAPRWGLTTFGKDIALATGFGPSGIVLLHLISRMRQNPTVFYLQTDLLFPETLELRDHSRAAGNPVHRNPADLSLEEQAQEYGARLWTSNPDLCCHLRKVGAAALPGREKGLDNCNPQRSVLNARIDRVVDWDRANSLLKISPLPAGPGPGVGLPA